jgi:D-alanyl-D-alanine carboxypeptidase/D-alanyl-D-alanine-endopeptidase (penicillin-binding protein 4)
MAAAASLLTALLVTTDAAGNTLQDRLNAALRHPGCRGARIGALVVKASDGSTVFAHDSEVPLVPASNMKLLTAFAALATWGPAHRFTTEVLADASIDVDGSVTTLVIRGGGDPALTSEELWRLAADLRRLGLRRVRGDLILDDTYFDDQRWHPDWGAPSARAYHGRVSALSANYGAFQVQIVPLSGAASVARVTIDPPVPFFDLVADLRSGTSTSVAVDRHAAGQRERVTVTGSIRPGDNPLTIPRSALNPQAYAAAVLRLQFAALGIAVDGSDRFAPLPAGYRTLLTFHGKSVAELVGLMMKWSNNNIAEMLLKDLGAHETGRPGSWTTGVAATRRTLDIFGVEPRGLQMVDGSGLASTNRVTARTLVDVLRVARQSFAFGPEFEAMLPIAGRDGTLRERARDAADRARAKTGLLAGAAALSGYARTRAGDDVIFSIINNGADAGDAAAMAANDAFLEAVVR